MTAFILSLILAKSTVTQVRPVTQSYQCQTAAACARYVREVNGVAVGGQGMGPRK